MASPSQWGSSSRRERGTHSSTPSLHSPISPVQPSAVNRCIYSVTQRSETKVTMPRY